VHADDSTTQLEREAAVAEGLLTLADSEGIDMYAIISHVEDIDGFDRAVEPPARPTHRPHKPLRRSDTLTFETAADYEELDGKMSPELTEIEFDGESAMYDRRGANNPRGNALVRSQDVAGEILGGEGGAVVPSSTTSSAAAGHIRPDSVEMALADDMLSRPTSATSSPTSATSSQPTSTRRSISSTPSTRPAGASIAVVPDTSGITTPTMVAAKAAVAATADASTGDAEKWTMNLDALRANTVQPPATGSADAGGSDRSGKSRLSPSNIAHEIRKGRDGFMRVDTINEEASADLNESFRSVGALAPAQEEQGRAGERVRPAPALASLPKLPARVEPEGAREQTDGSGYSYGVSSDSGAEVRRHRASSTPWPTLGHVWLAVGRRQLTVKLIS